jgi:hypothetical protein
MHPWMLEQVAYEHRRDLLARASRPRVRPDRTWRKLATYMAMTRFIRRTAAAAPAPAAPTPGSPTMLAPLPRGNGIETGQSGAVAAARTSSAGEPARPASAA